MSILREMVRDLIYGPPSLSTLPGSERAFNPGTVAVDPSTRVFGVESETWSPAEYGSYVASSNAVYTVVKKRATYLSSLPFQLATLNSEGDADPVTKGALFELTRKVNPYWTWRRLVEMTEMSLCLWGVAYWFLERGSSATRPPTQIYWARPDRVKVVPHATAYVARFEYQPASGMEPIPYAPSEVIWFRYPNPLDEYSGLSPLAAARLAADTQSAAMKQNYQLFKNGVSIGGLVTPAGDRPLGKEQGREIAEQLQERAKGTANAHRWLVLLNDAKFQSMTLSPRDAEFVELHKLTLEDIARPYGVPLDLIGGQRTYANYGDAVKSMWSDTIIPEAAFLADELTEQLLPMFARDAGRADTCYFDHSKVDALQEDQEAKWRIEQGMLQSGRKTINELRKADKEDPVAWGDAWWGSVALTPITTSELPEPEPIEPEPQAEGDGDVSGDTQEDDTEEPARARFRAAAARLAYGSDEHERLWRAFIARTDAHESKVARATRGLLRSQEQSILTALGKFTDDERSVARIALPQDIDTLMARLFSVQRWRRRFRETIRPVLRVIAADAGQAALDEVSLGGSFDVADPLIHKSLERRTQRFAQQINETTWQRLKDSLGEGLAEGESVDQLAVRVRRTMGDRIRSSGEVISRTETAAVMNESTHAGWRQSGQVQAKEWLAALDDRCRETHVDAHGQVVALDANFVVGGSRGPSPGNIAAAAESINCRCSMLAVVGPPIE